MRTSLIFLLAILYFTGHTQPIFAETKLHFNSKEISDSAFRKLYAVRYYYDYNYAPEWADSFYQTRFDNRGRIVYEKIDMGIGDSTLYTYAYQDTLISMIIKETYSHVSRWRKTEKLIRVYNKDGQVISSEQITGSPEKPATSSKDTFYYDLQKRLIKRLPLGNSGWSIYYTYDKKGRLSKTDEKTSTSPSYIYYYSYNDLDSITSIKQVESYGRRIDSVIYMNSYDNKGRLIEKSRIPSKTYHKTFNLDCSTGDYYCFQYDYDSLNRKTFEANLEWNLRGEELLYASHLYTSTHYNEYGYVIQSYDLNFKPDGQSIYARYEEKKSTPLCITEYKNSEVIFTKFLSETINLPARIDITSNEGSKVTTVYTYYK